MKSRAREQASSSIPLRGRHERGAEKNGKQMRSQGASRSENHDGKQQDMTTHEQNAKSDRQTRPEPAHNSHKSKTNDTPRPPRVRPRGQERERKKWSIWYYVVQFSSARTTKCRMGGSAQRRLPGAWAGTGSNGGTTAYLWVGDSPAEVSDRCGGCCLFCLSVCLLSLSRGGWCVVGLPSCLWPAICEPLVSLRTFCLGLPLGVSCLGFLLGAASLGREPVRFLLMMRR